MEDLPGCSCSHSFEAVCVFELAPMLCAVSSPPTIRFPYCQIIQKNWGNMGCLDVTLWFSAVESNTYESIWAQLKRTVVCCFYPLRYETDKRYRLDGWATRIVWWNKNNVPIIPSHTAPYVLRTSFPVRSIASEVLKEQRSTKLFTYPTITSLQD